MVDGAAMVLRSLVPFQVCFPGIWNTSLKAWALVGDYQVPPSLVLTHAMPSSASSSLVPPWLPDLTSRTTK